MNLTVREFQAGDEAIFQALNEAWIRTYLKLEDKDCEILGDPKRNFWTAAATCILQSILKPDRFSVDAARW